MSTEPDLSYHPAMNEICLGVMDAVGNQPGDTPARIARRRQTVADAMSSMVPHNPLQTMLAGQCVMFDNVVRDAVGDLMRGQTEDIKLRVRPQICAAGKMLLANLTKFQQLQATSSAKLGGPLKAPAQTEPARPAAKAPSAPVAAQAAAPEAAQAPVPDESAAPPERDQPKQAVPPVTRRELTSAMAGRTRAEIDDALIAAYRELSPRGGGETSATPVPGDTKQAKRVEEPV